MSALGEYIHLYYKNYQRYGVTRRDENGAPFSYNGAIENRINSLPDFKPETIKELQRRLKLNTAQQINKDSNEEQKQQQILIDQIYSLLYERSSRVSGVNRVASIAAGNGWIIDSAGNKKQLSTTANWASSLSHEELISRFNKANQLYDQIQTLITEINSQQPQSEEKIQSLLILFQKYSHLSADSLQGSTVGEIQKAITEKRYSNIAGNIGGTFGEMLVAICDNKAATLANKSVAQFIQQAVKGAERTEILIDKSLISQNKGDYFLNTSTKDNTQYTLGSTQNKVDVQINVNNENLLASVKSYAINGPYARPDLQEVNLFTTILYLNNEIKDFGNHWLNIHTSHPGRSRAFSGQSDLDEIVKKEVAYQALSSGNPFKKEVDKANIFIFINRATGQVFIKSIKNILNNDLDSIRGLDKIYSIYLDNHKSKDIQDRIGNVLVQLHQQKISVAYNIKMG